MSRTYRTTTKQLDCNCNKKISEEEMKESIRTDTAPWRGCNCVAKYDYSKNNCNRDSGSGCMFSAPAWFRQIHNRSFRSKVRHEMANKRYDRMPINKNTVAWDWW